MRKENDFRDRLNQNEFVQKILDNKIVTSLLIVLIILLIILIFTRISYLFEPLITFFDLMAFPIIGAGILYYLLSPIVTKLTSNGLSKNTSIWIIFALLIGLMVWGVVSLVPVLRKQAETFAIRLPFYLSQLNQMLNNLPLDNEQLNIGKTVSDFISSIDLNSITDRLNMIITSTFGGLGSVIGTVSQFVAGLLTMPILLYYLLAEGDKLPKFILYLCPTHIRPTVSRMLFKSNYQVSQYIRGQITVAIIVGIMFAIGYTIIGLDYAISLAVMAGILNIIPYIGSIIAVIPALIIGLLTSPMMLIKVVIVMFLEQFIEGRFVSPMVLGSNLKIHPVTILFVLLGAGRLYGITGVVLGVPAYAVIKVIVMEVYKIYRTNSNLYEDEESIHPQPLISKDEF